MVYALPEGADCVALALPAGATARDAVAASGLLQRHPEIAAAATLKLGIFGRSVAPNAPLEDGDRVEVYRRLLADAKQVRRQRALRKPISRR